MISSSDRVSVKNCNPRKLQRCPNSIGYGLFCVFSNVNNASFRLIYLYWTSRGKVFGRKQKTERERMQPPVHMEINTEEHFFCLFFGFHGTIGEKMPFLKCFCCLLFDAAMRLAFWPVVTRPGVKKVANDKSLEIPRNKSAHGKERQTDQHSKTTSIYFEVDKPATSPPPTPREYCDTNWSCLCYNDYWLFIFCLFLWASADLVLHWLRWRGI